MARISGMSPSSVVAIDVGGTTIKTALISGDIDPDTEVVAESRTRTPREDGPDAVVRTVLDVAAAAVEDARARDGRLPDAVGVAVLGLVDEAAGVATLSTAVGWRDVPLRELLARRLPVPVVIGQDLRTAALAEARLGCRRSDLLFVALGTGVGGALVLGGRPVRGGFGRAGELGHLVVRPDGAACPCGARGCVETLASAAAIAARYAEASGRTLGVDAIAELAAAGDRLAGPVWTDAVEALADGLAAAAVLFDPEVVVIGGGLSLAGPLLFEPLRTALSARVALGDPPPVRPSELGDRAAVLGAGLLAREMGGTC